MSRTLNASKEGQCQLQWTPVSVAPTSSRDSAITIYPVNSDINSNDRAAMVTENANTNNTASNGQILKFHRHIGHADVPTIFRIIKQAGFVNTHCQRNWLYRNADVKRRESLRKIRFFKLPSAIPWAVCIWGYFLSVG